MSFRRIVSRVIVSAAPIIALSVILFVVVINRRMGGQIITRINENMDQHLQRIELVVTNEFDRNANIAVSLAKFAQTVDRDAGYNVRDFLMNMIPTNVRTVGGGIWYEPYAFDPSEKFFGQYVHILNGRMINEPEYASAADYHAEVWYQNGRKSQGEPIWSGVSFNSDTNIYMITATVPFFDGGGNMLGVATADMSINDIQRMIANLQLGNAGKAFIIGQCGRYVAHYDDGRILNYSITAETDPALAAFGQEMMRNGTGMAIVELADNPVHAYYRSIDKTDWILVVMRNRGEIFSGVAKIILQNSAAPIAGLLILAVCMMLVISYVTKTANKINDFARKAAEGDLSVRLQIKENDEFGEIEKRLNNLVGKMSELYANSADINERIADSSGAFNSLAQAAKERADVFSLNLGELGDNLKSLAAAGEEINASVREISAETQNTAEKGVSIASQIGNAMNAGKSGLDLVRQVVNEIEVVAKDAGDAVKSVRELSERVNQIRDFVARIGGIADQTNLLALNAAIEAARAGDAGRGFAVVADEVRKLAENSNAAAASIADLAQTITGDLDDVASISESNAKASLEAKALSGNTVEIIGDVMTYLGDIANAARELAAVSREKAASSTEISGAVQDMANKALLVAEESDVIISGAVSSEADGIAQGAEALSELAGEIESMLGAFTLGGGTKRKAMPA